MNTSENDCQDLAATGLKPSLELRHLFATPCPEVLTMIALFKTWLSKSWILLGQRISTLDPCQELCLSWLGLPRREHKWTWLSRLGSHHGFEILHFSPPARWGLLDFMSVACSSSPPLLLISSSPPPRRPPRPPRPTATRDPQCSLSDLNHDHPCSVFPAGPQPRPSTSVCPAGPQPWPSTPSVPCRTSTTTIHAQCSLPDLNHDHPRPVFPAGPQPRVSTPSVPCRTSCRKIWDKECAEES